MTEYEKITEDVIAITGSKEWTEGVMKMLEAEAAASLQNQLEAKSWEEVNFQRGYRQALEFVANIREITKALTEAQDASV